MGGATVEIRGDREVARAMHKGARPAAEKALKTLTIRVLGNVIKATVVDTGNLRSSMAHEFLGSLSSRVGTLVEYGEYVEYGTERMEARHMEGGSKVLGEGMMAYTLRTMDSDIRQFETEVVKSVEGEIKQ